MLNQQLTQQLEFTELTSEEFERIYYDWMKGVAWKPIVDSTSAHFTLAKGTIFCLKLKGRIIATIAASRYPELKIAYLGFYIVHDEFRHSGLGRYLWGKASSILEADGYNLEFDSPPELVQYYSGMGYQEFSTMSIRQLQDTSILNERENPSYVQAIDNNNLRAVIKFDQTILPGKSRTEFLPKWFNKESTYTAMYMQDDEVQGYGVISKQLIAGNEYAYNYIIAPIYATTPNIAADIIKYLCSQTGFDVPIFMDTLDFNISSVKLATELGFKAIYEAHRLSSIGRLDEHRELVSHKVFALSSHAYAPL